MAILPISIARVSEALKTSVTTQSLATTQAQLLETENELSTGKSINQPSDNPAGAATVIQLNKTLEDRTAYSANLDQATSKLSQVDSTLNSVESIVQQAQSTASANVGSDVTAQARQSAASIITSLSSQLLTTSNTQLDGQYLFGGDKSDTAPFVSSDGTVQYVGSTDLLSNTYDQDTTETFQVNGSSVFGALTTQIDGTADLSPSLTAATQISDVAGATNAGVALGSIQISNGSISAVVDLSAADTVSDVIAKINAAGVGVQAQINAAGTGLNFLNTTQGTALSISENGGTTATDLGIRNFSPSTVLTSLNNGVGVKTAGAGTDDFQVTDSNGKSFSVDVTGDTTVQDVINSINSAATTAGAGVTAGFSTTSNGISLTDTAGGNGTLTLTEVNASQAASDLGLTTTAVNGVITGTDANAVSTDNIFGDLQKLQDALNNNDQTGITTAAEALQRDYNRVVSVRGANGAKIDELQDRQTQITDQNTATNSLLSSTEDADYTQVISKFESLQTSLQAGLEAASKSLQMSLLDFLS